MGVWAPLRRSPNKPPALPGVITDKPAASLLRGFSGKSIGQASGRTKKLASEEPGLAMLAWQRAFATAQIQTSDHYN